VFKKFQDILKDLFTFVGEGGKLTDFNVGSALRTILEAVAAIVEEVWYRLQFFVSLFFLGTSKGEWIDRRLNDLGMLRQEGSASYGLITAGRDSPSPMTIKISAGTVFQDETGTLQYITQKDAILNIGDSAVDIEAQATDIGSAYDLPPGTALKQAGIAISGLEWGKIKLMGGGADIESDEDYVNRVPEYFDSLSRGTGPALKYAAKDVKGVMSVTLKENYPSKGWFTIYIDDGSGVANETLLQSVRAVLEDYRAFTVKYIVASATLLDFTTQIQLTYDEDTQAEHVKPAVQSAIVKYVNALKMGQALYLSDLIFLARSIDGVKNVRVLDPAEDVIPAVDELLRTSAEKVVIAA
jgi:uncharacterized phage protein gp47/JayE